MSLQPDPINTSNFCHIPLCLSHKTNKQINKQSLLQRTHRHPSTPPNTHYHAIPTYLPYHYIHIYNAHTVGAYSPIHIYIHLYPPIHTCVHLYTPTHTCPPIYRTLRPQSAPRSPPASPSPCIYFRTPSWHSLSFPWNYRRREPVLVVCICVCICMYV